MQSDQLSPIGADMMSATSLLLSLSLYFIYTYTLFRCILLDDMLDMHLYKGSYMFGAAQVCAAAAGSLVAEGRIH